ncbi:MAG: hypothetical protein IKV39_00820 [Clostridia bacterium]|nr:hypothetical protein [Clostridia bacterium]
MLWDFTKEKFDIIIQAGQSNAEGCGVGNVEKAYAPTDKILHLDGDFTISVARERIDENFICSHFGLTFAKKYIEDGRLEDGRRVLIIRSAVGGTGFSDHRWGMTDDLYLRMMELIRTALDLNPENRVVAMLWHQGETDACNNMDEETYYNNLNRLIGTVRDMCGNTLPVICGDFVQDWKSKNAEICAPIISAQRKLTAQIGNSAFVETDDLLSNNQFNGFTWDDIHFARGELYVLGERYYEAFVKADKK